MTGPLLHFVNELLSLPVFATGRIAVAFDEIFGKTVDVNIDSLRKAIARHLIGKSFLEETLIKFIDYVAYHPRLHAFSKVKFVAAIEHLIIKFKPTISVHF